MKSILEVKYDVMSEEIKNNLSKVNITCKQDISSKARIVTQFAKGLKILFNYCLIIIYNG